MKKNQQGLSRNIPEDVKRRVRQKSGFGCVFCGSAIFQYEHIEPGFKDAYIHNSDSICLLCPTHHQKVTQKKISKKSVLEAYRNPKALQRGYSSDLLELESNFQVKFGAMFLYHYEELLVVDGLTILGFSPPEKGEPVKISGLFYDEVGKLVFEIRQNELISLAHNWDINQHGQFISVKKRAGGEILRIKINVDENILEIEKINMLYGSARIVTDANGLIFVQAGTATVHLQNASIEAKALYITNNYISFSGPVRIQT